MGNEGHKAWNVLMPTLVAFALLMAQGCAWNKAFLKPEPITVRKALRIDRQTGDTIVLRIDTTTFQPSFTTTNGTLVELPYVIESVLFTSDENTLNGWMIKPTAAEKVGTTILFLHGNGGNIYTEYPTALPFVERGAQVFVFDYSGYGLSTGKASRDRVLTDARSALEHVRSRPDVTGTDVVLYGQSLGGHTAALLACSEGFNSIVIEGGFLSFEKIGARHSHTGPLGKLLIKEGASAEACLKNYSGPLLVIHSREDRTVPFEMGQDMYSVANEPKRFLEFSGCHVCGPLLNPDEIMDAINAMLGK